MLSDVVLMRVRDRTRAARTDDRALRDQRIWIFQVADGVYFVSCLGPSGMTVSRVMGFNTGDAHVFGTKPDDNGVGGRAAETHAARMHEHPQGEPGSDSAQT
jgi:hypothetical protein